jgi:HD-GYP domain-containing protein (c-di-GMP phosphodiesterase class II)
MNNFEETYNQSIKTIRNLVEDVRFSRNLNLDAVKICAENICQYLHTDHNILSILNIVKDKNPYMYSHPVNVAFVSFVIGKWMNLKKYELLQLVCAGIMHDIGKAKIRDKILNKPGQLTEQEMEIMRTHPRLGFTLLSDLNVFDAEVLLGVLSHHERQDGSGYPNHLKGEQISLFGRIIAIADIYDAMTSTKPYHMKQSPFKGVEEIEASSFGSLDPQICQVFLKNIINFYPGSIVRLNNEQVGEIIYINPVERTRPIIHCGEKYINMIQEREIEIVEML